MEEAQTVNLDIAAATARLIQADAQARIAGASLLPTLNFNGQEAYSRTSGSSASGLSIGGREVVNYTPRSVRLMKSISGARTAMPRWRPRKPRRQIGSTATWSR